MTFTRDFQKRAAVVTALVLTLAGCGAVKPSTTTSPSAKPSGSSGSSGTKLHDLLPESIKSSGTVKVATGASYKPDQYVDVDGKTIIGWSVDILNEVGKRLDVKMDYANIDFPGILPAIQAKKYDLGSSSYGVTPDRLQAVDFVTYFQNAQYIAVAKGNPAEIDPKDVCGRKMAVTKGSISDKTADALSADCLKAGKPAIVKSGFPNAAAVYLALDSKRDEFSVVNGSTLGSLPETVESMGEGFLPVQVGFIFAKDSSGLRDAVNQAITAMIEDGSYVKILEKWNIKNGALPKSEVLPN